MILLFIRNRWLALAVGIILILIQIGTITDAGARSTEKTVAWLIVLVGALMILRGVLGFILPRADGRRLTTDDEATRR
jgi:predicted phage tail protein